MKLVLPGLFVTALLLCGTAAAQDAGAGPEAHSGPRILWGQHGDSGFEFDSRTPRRRAGTASRQAYFGSGAEYSETLARLQAQLQRMAARERFGDLELSPAQEAARQDMPPALLRALALSQGNRDQGIETAQDN